MYVTGTIVDFMSRIHQLGGDPIALNMFVTEHRNNGYSGLYNNQNTLNQLEGEASVKIWQMSGINVAYSYITGKNYI